MFHFQTTKPASAIDYSDLLNEKRREANRHRNSADIFASSSSMRNSSSDGFLSRSAPLTTPAFSATNSDLAAGLSDLTGVVSDTLYTFC